MYIMLTLQAPSRNISTQFLRKVPKKLTTENDWSSLNPCVVQLSSIHNVFSECFAGQLRSGPMPKWSKAGLPVREFVDLKPSICTKN